MSTGRTFGKTADAQKRTTKVNIGIVVGVALFLAMGVVGIYWLWKNTAG